MAVADLSFAQKLVATIERSNAASAGDVVVCLCHQLLTSCAGFHLEAKSTDNSCELPGDWKKDAPLEYTFVYLHATSALRIRLTVNQIANNGPSETYEIHFFGRKDASAVSQRTKQVSFDSGRLSVLSELQSIHAAHFKATEYLSRLIDDGLKNTICAHVLDFACDLDGSSGDSVSLQDYLGRTLDSVSIPAKSRCTTVFPHSEITRRRFNIAPWDTFTEEVADFIGKLSGKLVETWPGYPFRESATIHCEEDVGFNMQSHVFSRLQRIPAIAERKGEFKYCDSKTGKCDKVYVESPTLTDSASSCGEAASATAPCSSRNGNNETTKPACETKRVVFEFKHPEVFDGVDDIVAWAYKHLKGVTFVPEAQLDPPEKRVLDSLFQIVGYMDHHNLAYGILSTYTKTWLLKRSKDFVQISPPIGHRCISPTKLESVYFLISQEDYTSEPIPDESPTKSRSDQGDSSGDSPDDQKKSSRRKREDSSDYEPDGSASSRPTTPTPINSGNKRDRKRMKQSANRVAIKRSDYRLGPELGSGRTGDVALATYKGREAVMKYVDCYRNPDGIPELENEARVYALLRSIQGTVIPRVECYGGCGMFHMLIFDCEVATPLSEVAYKLSVELKRKIIDALDVLHSHFVLHNDVRPENILLNERSGKVTIIDLALATVTRDESKLQAEKAALLRELAHL